MMSGAMQINSSIEGVSHSSKSRAIFSQEVYIIKSVLKIIDQPFEYLKMLD